jgi:hypothetical protein
MFDLVRIESLLENFKLFTLFKKNHCIIVDGKIIEVNFDEAYFVD